MTTGMISDVIEGIDEIQPGDWFEIWYVSGIDMVPSYLVVVCPNSVGSRSAAVLDIYTKEIAYKGVDHKDTYEWLTEDGFIRLTGRESVFPGHDEIWFEVWYEQGELLLPSRLFVVTPDPEVRGEITVRENFNGDVLTTNSNYDEIVNWMGRNGFQLASSGDRSMLLIQ